MNKKTLLSIISIPILLSGCLSDLEINGIEQIKYLKNNNLSECQYVKNDLTKGKIIKIDLYDSSNLNLSKEEKTGLYTLSGKINYEIQPNTQFGPSDAPKKYWQGKRDGKLYFKCPENK